jgi:hypothetical protein
MSTRRDSLLAVAGMSLILLASGASAAEGETPTAAGEPKAGGLASLLGALSEVQIPSLSGLIQPERMGVLTDNECRIEDNQPHLLSDNQADRDFLSGNQVNILSGLHLLSDITVTVQVTVGDGDRKAAKAKKADGDRKSNKADKSKKRKAARNAKGT